MVDVTAGVRLVLDVLCDPGPVVLPTPAYHPQFQVIPVAGRELWELPIDPDAPTAELDLDRLDALFAAGARTLLLTHPHNPLGHVYSRAELEGIRDVALRHGARVISDEIHGAAGPPRRRPTCPTSRSTAPPTTASRCSRRARRSTPPGCGAPSSSPPTPPTRDVLRDVPMVRNDSWSVLGVVASVAAPTPRVTPGSRPSSTRLDAQRTLLAALLAEHLPRGADAAADGDLPRLDRPA